MAEAVLKTGRAAMRRESLSRVFEAVSGSYRVLRRRGRWAAGLYQSARGRDHHHQLRHRPAGGGCGGSGQFSSRQYVSLSHLGQFLIVVLDNRFGAFGKVREVTLNSGIIKSKCFCFRFKISIF